MGAALPLSRGRGKELLRLLRSRGADKESVKEEEEKEDEEAAAVLANRFAAG